MGITTQLKSLIIKLDGFSIEKSEIFQEEKPFDFKAIAFFFKIV